MSELTPRQRRECKARAQRLKPLLKVGKSGVSDAFVRSLDAALASHELVKAKFEAFKERKSELANDLAEKTGSALVHQVGNVVVFYRRNNAREPGACSP